MTRQKWRKFQLGLMTGEFNQKIKEEATTRIEEFVPGIYEMTGQDMSHPEYLDNGALSLIMSNLAASENPEKMYIHTGPFVVYNFPVERTKNINDGLM